ncbi:HAD family hydrolase [Gordonia sp. 852002-50816_SCH5313054-c]|uniref:HAD family hydrolase n=1 Tax=unclassified Gordonia (in: high G+C Gram-positive bacteria) TaxID=2657482 RepID=UPI0007EA840E|nr:MULTISPECIES: HAD family phosphatase [unclassified Gordonia (in: high G+C Gram-positive bacteria)]OBC08038.1 HAD family hydrolase [Gordonia sp. 852002-50816_SCH5313054-a]OBC21468.1 HAD family hydrolase [Gordonia sp. 852002-50816_SCH5313054-c]
MTSSSTVRSSSTTRSAVLVDFGGVVTTSVLDAFRGFGTEIGDRDLPLHLLGHDEQSRTLLADHEAGRIDAETFDVGFAARLGAHGVTVSSEGLSARMQHRLERDDETVAMLSRLRAASVPVALVSNAFGRDTYAGFELSELADVVVISSEVGIRKPSRRIFEIACERLGVAPHESVMIDDLQQNLDGAAKLGIAGVLHTDGADTARQLSETFGLPATA